jgi:nitrogen fixation NifU-like protein
MSQEELYKEIILDHATHPRNSGALPPPARKIEADNPLCGDELSLYLVCASTSGGEPTIQNCKFEAQACAICVASASILTTKVKGKTLSAAENLAQVFQNVLRQPADEPIGEAARELGDLGVLEGVRKFPLRVKCATLPWHALTEGIRQSRADQTAS